MAPKKVNKDEKRREVALACYELVHQGIRNITVAQVAKTAGIGKGTVYEYFENKEDIIFEIINIHIEEYHQEFLLAIQDVESTREKLFLFFKFVIDDSPETLRHLNGYKDYLSIVLSEDNEAMKEFNTSCDQFFNQQIMMVIDEGIKNGELIPQSKKLINGLVCFEKGVALMKMTKNDFDAKMICEEFINTLFEIIEVKNDTRKI